MFKRIKKLENEINDSKKEIENLKEINKEHQKLNGELREEIDELQSYIKEYLIPKSTINLLYVSKDKIRAKIKSLEEKIHIVIPNEYNKVEIMNEFKNEGAVDILKELLEEE